MKIGILTYHSAHNYGAVLQAYSLQQFLKVNGYDVYIINYKPKYLKYGPWVWYNWFSLTPTKFIKKIKFQIFTFMKQYLRNHAFNHFIKYYLSPIDLNLNLLIHDFDVFIVGSDQIWRKNRDKFDDIYWGKFYAANKSLLIAYGASMGKKVIDASDKKYISEALEAFCAIGVRELSLKSILSPLSDKPIKIVLDPTFLLDRSQWNRIAQSPKVNYPYVLIYQVISIQATQDLAQQVAKVLNADIVEISSGIKIDHKRNVIQTASPEEFLGWVREASCVITTSFHGTAFSLIYGKPFMCLKQHKDSDLRMESILSCTGQLHRFIDCKTLKWETDMLNTFTVDYSLLLKESKSFLFNAIRDGRPCY